MGRFFSCNRWLKRRNWMLGDALVFLFPIDLAPAKTARLLDSEKRFCLILPACKPP
jgi:hypothetical protein